MNFKRALITVLLLVLFFTTACSGGSDSDSEKSGNNIVGLKLPRSISIGGANTPQDTSTSTQSSIAAVATDPGTDYSTDPVDYYTTGNSGTGIQFANTLLCLIDELDATEKVNQGPFNATVPASVCVNEESGDNTNTMELTVLSYRTSNDSPHFIQIWLNDKTFGDEVTITGEFVIFSGVSESNPFGEFTFYDNIYMNPSLYEGLSTELTLTDQLILKSYTGNNGLPRIEFQFNFDESEIYEFGSTGHYKGITQITAANFQQGQSREYSYNTYTDNIYESDHAVAFNSTHAMTSKQDAGIISVTGCFSRNDRIDSVWDYNIYFNEDGDFNGQSVTAGQRLEPATSLSVNFDYIHLAANDRNNTDPLTNPYHGLSYPLDYFGWDNHYGSLDGIPWDLDTYQHLFALKDGTILTSSTGQDFLVKAVDIDHKMKTVVAEDCSALNSNGLFNNTEIDPKNLELTGAISISLDDWPEVN